MILSFLKNPIILAILAAGLTYLYLWWENEKKNERNPKIQKEQVNFMTPAIVGALTWFIAYNYFGSSSSNVTKEANNEESKIIHDGGVKLIDADPIKNKTNISERLTDSFDSKTFHLVGKNAIKLPQTDVFIDIAKF